MTVCLLDPRTDAEPAAWREFTRRLRLPPMWDFSLLRLEAWLAGNRPLLALAWRDGEIVAAVTAVVCRHRGTRRYAPARAIGPLWAEVRVSWLSGAPAYAFAPDLDLAARREFLRTAETALRRALGPGFLGVVYRTVAPADLPLVAGRGRITRPIEATAVLPNAWPDVDGWLASLGKERRRSIRRYARVIDRDPAVCVERGPAREDLEPSELAALLNDHNDRLGVPAFAHRTKMAAAYLGALVRRPDVHTLTYRDTGGRLLAFNTFLDHPETPVLHFWAARPVSDGGRYNLYFDCYLRGVRHMIDHGRAELAAGRGLLAVKASLGFQLRPVSLVVVPRPVLGR
jgi:hypothetical protein